MEHYFGEARQVFGKPMTKGEYNKYRGWKMPEGEDPNEKGYLVEYPDSQLIVHSNHKNYISWSPEGVFKMFYNSSGNLNFGHAIQALKEGRLVARKGWNGKGMFLFIRPADDLPVDMIINKVKSLPDSFKNWLSEDVEDTDHIDELGVRFGEYICMKAADGSVVNGWLASQTDMLSEDWEVVG